MYFYINLSFFVKLIIGIVNFIVRFRCFSNSIFDVMFIILFYNGEFRVDYLYYQYLQDILFLQERYYFIESIVNGLIINFVFVNIFMILSKVK